jgi:hydroxymethylpyrimidine pyrophosphatase-like HAD family hydrolase
VVIATGRAVVECTAALESVKHEGLVVAAGGSLLSDTALRRTVYRHILPLDLVVELTKSLVSHGHKALILKDSHAVGYDYLAVGPGRLDPASEWWFNHLSVSVQYVESLDEDAHPQDTVRAGAVASGIHLEPLADRLRQSLGERCFLQHWSAVTETQAIGSTTHLLEVFGIGVNKWTMVERICRDRGIDRSRVAAIGDGLNDLESVREAGLGIAMGNASGSVRAVADQITDDYESDGVATAVHRILDGRW